MTISLIVAMSEGGVIGRAGGLPWHLPADLARFKRITMGHTIVMGRKTYESIGRPLPGRTSVVVTRQRDYRANAGVIVAANLAEALQRAAGDDEVFVVGGAEIYRQALPRVERLYVTHIHARVEGEVCFPAFDPAEWRLCEEMRRQPDARNALPLSFAVYQRRAAGGA